MWMKAHIQLFRTHSFTFSVGIKLETDSATLIYRETCLSNQLKRETNFYLIKLSLFVTIGCLSEPVYCIQFTCLLYHNILLLQVNTYPHLKNDDDVTLLFSCPIIQAILDHKRQPIVYLSRNIDYVNSSRLFRLVYKIYGT